MAIQRAKTEEEYKAAALLLGMNYCPIVNSFWLAEDFDEYGRSAEHEWDADTMEKLTEQEISRRHSEYDFEVGVVHVTPGGNDGT